MLTVSKHPKTLNWRVIFLKIVLIFLFLAVLSLCCCEGPSVVAIQRLLIVVASVVEEHRL